MNRNMKSWLNELMKSDVRKALPVMTYPGLELIGMQVMDIITDGSKQGQCIQALSTRFDTLAAVTTMDLSVEAEAFGSEVRFTEGEVPTVIGKIITDPDSAKNLIVPAVGSGRTSVYLEGARYASQEILDRPTLGGMIGPFSLAGRLMDMTEIMVAMSDEPELVHLVLEKCNEFLISYAQAFKDAGANGLIIAEPAAGLMSPANCEEFSSQYIKRIVDKVQDDYFMVIVHNCGNTIKQVESLVGTGAFGLHFGNAVRMSDILPQMPADRMAFGNIDPARTFRNGTLTEMRNQVNKLLQDMAPYPNFVLSSGCDIPPGTSIEMIDVFFDLLDRFNKSNQRG